MAPANKTMPNKERSALSRNVAQPRAGMPLPVSKQRRAACVNQRDYEARAKP
ncbi:MAG: hypothetical protein Q4A11_06380 [Brachymonas sp.]|nr:hypothetical protein [Brachymonas sp.]